MAIELQTRWEYKISRDGVYLGLLQNVTNDFGYSNEINTAGPGIQVDVALTGDTAGELVEVIQTEDGLTLETESSLPLTTERSPDVVGNYNERALIRNGNDMEIVEYSPSNPNGITVFQGYISRWKASFGETDGVSITVLSYGVGLNNRIIQTGVTSIAELNIDTTLLPGAFWGYAFAQSITPSVDTDVDQIEIKVSTSDSSDTDYEVLLCQGNPDLDILGVIGGEIIYSYGGTNTVLDVLTPGSSVSTSVVQTITLSLPSTRTFSALQQYYVLVKTADGFGISNADKFRLSGAGSGDLPISISPFGTAYVSRITSNNTSNSLNYSSTYPAFYVNLLYSGGSVLSTYSSVEVSDIVRDIIDDASAQTGVEYDASSIQDTGVIVSYDFIVNTTLEGIKKMITLAPANWYWYVDPGTSMLHFKAVSTTATHTFIKGKHLSSLDLQATIENLKNIVYFTGGATAGVNLFKKVVDTESLALNRTGVERIVDNRVTSLDTATTIAESYLEENSSERYTTTVVILDSTYDISTINLGETVSFGGFGVGFIDNLILQIVGIRRAPGRVTLMLGMLPRRQSTAVENIQRGLLETQTVDNPSAPS